MNKERFMKIVENIADNAIYVFATIVCIATMILLMFF